MAKNIKREDGTRQWDRVGVWEDQFVDENAPLPDDREISAFVWLGFNDEKFNRYLENGFEVIRNDCWYIALEKLKKLTFFEIYHTINLFQPHCTSTTSATAKLSGKSTTSANYTKVLAAKFHCGQNTLTRPTPNPDFGREEVPALNGFGRAIIWPTKVFTGPSLG